LATSENRLEISGRTEKEAEVKINGEVVLDNQAVISARPSISSKA
jgi:hypothetical protein